MQIKQQIISSLKESLVELGVTDIEPQLEIPQDYEHGDYSSNIAMEIFSRGKGKGERGKNVQDFTLYASPFTLSKEIVNKLQLSKLIPHVCSSVKAVAPGFINFQISQDFLGNYLNDLLSKKDVYTAVQVSNPRFEMYENTQPNTNKPLHIGHLRNIALGSSIVNLRKTLGHKVWSVNINNDRGIHIVKGMWAYLAFGQSEKRKAKSEKLEKPDRDWGEMLQDWIDDPSKWDTPEQTGMKADHFVGKFYVLGDKAEAEHGEAITQQFKEMLKAWEEGDVNVRKLWKQMNDWFYEGFLQTHARFLGINPSDNQFDKEWFESNVYEAGKKIVFNNFDSENEFPIRHSGDPAKPETPESDSGSSTRMTRSAKPVKGLFYKREDGPIVANLKKYGLPDKVVIRSDGTSIYITQDIELARVRIQEEKADFTAYIVGNEQDLHFKQLFAICEELGIGKRNQFLHISYGMVNLSGGVKMSSREGTAVIADELMDSVTQQVRSLFDSKDEKVTEQVAIGAMKYWMLKYNPKAAITFDVKESVSIQGNSGPYLQYTFARTQSVLTRVRGEGERVKSLPFTLNASPYVSQPEELLLLRLLYRFPDVVEEAAVKFSPNLLCNYLFELASQFNLFYQKYKILPNVILDPGVRRTIGDRISYGDPIGSPDIHRDSLQDDRVSQFRLALTEGVGIVIEQGLQMLGIAAPSKM